MKDYKIKRDDKMIDIDDYMITVYDSIIDTHDYMKIRMIRL
jgi:hypothetical protein